MHLYGQFSLLNELKAILNVGKSVEENPHEAYYARPIMPVANRACQQYILESR